MANHRLPCWAQKSVARVTGSHSEKRGQGLREVSAGKLVVMTTPPPPGRSGKGKTEDWWSPGAPTFPSLAEGSPRATSP